MRLTPVVCMSGIVFLVLAFAGSAQAQNLILNGSFEDGICVPDSPPPPWQLIQGKVDGCITQWQAADGIRSIDLNGSGPSDTIGGIAQIFPTTPGSDYLVLFSLAGNPDCCGGPALKTGKVRAAGQSRAFSFDTTGQNRADMGWVEESWTFEANSGLTSLEFVSTTVGGNAVFGPALDNVRVFAVSPTIDVLIDIKPGSFPNSISLKSKGVIPVAILSSLDFDAATIDPMMVQFGPSEAVPAHKGSHLKDVDQDGSLDLVLHFRTRETGILCGDTSASLMGQTFDGQNIQGSDSVRTVGCK